MARLFRPKYKDKRGKTKQVETWWMEFRSPNGIVQRWGLSTTDQDVAEITASQICSLNEWAKKGLDPPDDLVKWVRRQSPKFRDKIYKSGLLSPVKTNLTKPLTEHLVDYRNSLLAKSKGTYPYQAEARIAKIIEGCGFKFWPDVDGFEIDKYIAKRIVDGLGQHTAKHYITVFRQFSNWLKKQGRITNTPVIQSVRFDKAERRAFEYDEWRRLLEATRKGKVRSKMSGYMRYVVYKLAMETGLRREELNSLTRSSFNLDNCTVYIPGKQTKNDKAAVQSMTPETASLIKDLVKDKMPNVRIFRIPGDSAKMIRMDCEAANIETENHKGKITYHSLRHTCATFLVNQGVDVKVVQTIMRHSKIETTMEYYTHVLRGSEAEAVNRLRNIEQAPAKEQTA